MRLDGLPLRKTWRGPRSTRTSRRAERKLCAPSCSMDHVANQVPAKGGLPDIPFRIPSGGIECRCGFIHGNRQRRSSGYLCATFLPDEAMRSLCRCLIDRQGQPLHVLSGLSAFAKASLSSRRRHIPRYLIKPLTDGLGFFPLSGLVVAGLMRPTPSLSTALHSTTDRRIAALGKGFVPATLCSYWRCDQLADCRHP